MQWRVQLVKQLAGAQPVCPNGVLDSWDELDRQSLGEKHTFPCSSEMCLECRPPVSVALVTFVEQVPGVDAGKVLDSAVGL